MQPVILGWIAELEKKDIHGKIGKIQKFIEPYT